MKITYHWRVKQLITALPRIYSVLVGGWLARPHDHFPKTFISQIWIKYLVCCLGRRCVHRCCRDCCFTWTKFVNLLLNYFGKVWFSYSHLQTVRSGYFNRVTSSRRSDGSESLLVAPRSKISTTNFQEHVFGKLSWNFGIAVLVRRFGREPLNYHDNFKVCVRRCTLAAERKKKWRIGDGEMTVMS